MTKAEEIFQKITEEIPGVSEEKMFGALCIKAKNGKSGVMLWKEEMIFKLDGVKLSEALKLKGSKLFDPMGGRPMKEWVQIPFSHSKKWMGYAKSAMEKVKKIKK